jgi:hypothetical protein
MKKLLSIALSLVLGCTMFFAFPLSANALAEPARTVTDQAELYAALRDGEKKIDIAGVISLTEDLVIPGGVNVSVLLSYSLAISDGIMLTNNGTLSNKGGLAGYGTLVNSGVISNNGTFSNSNILSNSGTILNDDTGTFSSSGVLSNTNSFTNRGLLINNGEMNSSGTIANIGTFSNNDTLINNGSISNTGVIANLGIIGGSGSIATPPPNITTDNLPLAILGEPYSVILSADNNPTEWRFADPASATSLGLSIDSASGELSGTINTLGDHPFYIVALNENGSHLKELTLFVIEKPEEYPFDPSFPDVTDNTKSVEGTVLGDFQNDFWSGSDGIELWINNKLLVLDTDYLTREGSLIITLNPSYLQTLDNGTYAVNAWFRIGSSSVGLATTTLTIAIPGQVTPSPTPASGSTSPKTGDETNIPLLLMLSIVSIAGIGTATVWRRKRPQ